MMFEEPFDRKPLIPSKPTVHHLDTRSSLDTLKTSEANPSTSSNMVCLF